MKIGYVGAGTWGFALASLLASNGHDLILWTSNIEFAQMLSKKREHPKLARFKAHERVKFTSDLKEVLEGAEFLIESVTSMGIRPVFEQILSLGNINCPIVVTSKGIEQNKKIKVSWYLLKIPDLFKIIKMHCRSAYAVIRLMPLAQQCNDRSFA